MKAYNYNSNGKSTRSALVTVLILSLLAQSTLPAFAYAARTPLTTESMPPASTKVEASDLLFRTRVTVRTLADWARLEKLGVVVLETTANRQPPTTAVVLADEEQLEALARLRFEPQGTDELGMLVTAHAQAKPWLAASLRTLLSQAAAVQKRIEVEGVPSNEALADLRAAMRTLTPEQKAGMAALTSVDDDGDGLTNTEEDWWCTDPDNPNSDGDTQGYTDGEEVTALLDFTLPRSVRWGDYGPPFGPPNLWPDWNGQDDNPNTPACNDGDWDTIPDFAEVYMVGTRVNDGETTDYDKFDDGQELFGVTYCPGAPTSCGYGNYPRQEYWNYIKAGMPNWVLPPGDNPFVAAFPVPQVSVEPGTWHVERVTTITTEEGEIVQTNNTYETSVTRGQSTSIADTVTWNEWEEVSQAVETPLGQQTGGRAESESAMPMPARFDPRKFGWGFQKLMYGGQAFVGGAALTAIGGASCLPTGGIGCGLAVLGSVASPIGFEVAKSGWKDIQDSFRKDDSQDQEGINEYSITNVNNVSASAEANASVTLNQDFDFQGMVNSLDGVAYAINKQGDLLARGLYDISYAISQPRYTETRTNGHSWGGAQTTTHEEYEEHTQTEGIGFTTGQNWSTAWAVDSSHAANLTFNYTIRNIGSEYAKELTGVVFNISIGDDITPTISYSAWEQFPNGKLENLFPDAPTTPPGVIKSRTFTSNPIPLTLEQMKRIDLGERLTVKLESFSYGADELFYADAVNGGVTVFIEDGVEDGDELVDSYVIPTWGTESVQDVLTRYFPAGYDAEDNLNALWTPEFDGINPPTWYEHFLSNISWWNVYLTQPDAGNTPLKDLPAVAGSALLFRFNRDFDRDGYNDRTERRYYCSLPENHSESSYCGSAHLRADVYPQPEVLAGYVVTRTGNTVTTKLVLENTGTFDAYGIDAVMYSPDSTTTIGNNTVGGNGRVRPGSHVAVGSLVKPPVLANWGSSTAKPYASGNYTGSADRTYTFSVTTHGEVGQDNTAMSWSDGAGGNGMLDLGSSYHSPLPLDVAQGLQIGLNTGTIAAEASFTVEALTPRDTFTYTINPVLASPFPISTAPGDQEASAVTYNSAVNEYLVVWLDNRNGARKFMGQRISSTGTLLGDDFVIYTATDDVRSPVVAYNSVANEYLVVWDEYVYAIGHADIFGQRVSSTGTLLGDKITISSAPSGQNSPDIAYSSAANEYLVVWEDYRNAPADLYDIYGQRIGGTGSLLGGNFPISQGSEHQVQPAVAYNTLDNKYLVVWHDQRSGGWDIYGQQVSVSGALQGSDFPISTATGDQVNSDVVYSDHDNEYLVVWQDGRNGPDHDIYGQRISASGALQGNEFPISTEAVSSGAPIAVYDGTADQYVVIWQDGRNGPDTDIYGQIVSGAGSLQGDNFSIPDAESSQTSPAVAYGSISGKSLIAWHDDRNSSTSGFDVYGQWFPLPTTHTEPIIVVSYSDPQGSHRFITPAQLNSLADDLTPYSGQMLEGVELEMTTAAPFDPERDNTTHFVFNSPHPQPMEDAHLYVNFVVSGTVVAELPFTTTLQPGPTVFPVIWSTSVFTEPYDANADYLVMGFWTDRQDNIIDTISRPLSSFQVDPLAKAAVPTLHWDVGTLRWPESFSTPSSVIGTSHTEGAEGVVKQSPGYRLLGSAGQPAAGTPMISTNYSLVSGYWAAVRARQDQLQASTSAANGLSVTAAQSANDATERFPTDSFPIANIGWQSLQLRAADVDDITVSQVPSSTLSSGQYTEVGVRLNTNNLGIGSFEKFVPIRTNDPTQSVIQLRITGDVEPASDAVFVYNYQNDVRPLNKIAHVNSVRDQGDVVHFQHGISGDVNTLHPLFLYAGDDTTLLGRGAVIESESPVLRQTVGDSASTDLTLTDNTFDRRDYIVRYGYQADLASGGGQHTYQVPLLNRNYGTVILDVLAHDPASNVMDLSLDVGGDGSEEWTFSGDVSATGGIVPADGLADAINAYLDAQGGDEVTVPIRFTGDTQGAYFLTNLRGTLSTDYDLTPTNINVPDTPVETEVIQICATVANDGQGTVSAAVVSFFAGDPDVDGLLIGHDVLTDLAAEMGQDEGCVDWDTTGYTGDLTLYAYADFWNQVEENNEDNNAITTPVSVLSRPDLHVTAIELSDPEPVTGQPVTVTLTISNTGQTDAGTSALALYDGNPESGGTLVCERTAAVPGEGETARECTWTPAAPGSHRLFAVSDRDDAVNEFDEGNNQSWQDVYVGFAGPIELNSGASPDPAYDPAVGYGYVDEGVADDTITCGTEPHQTQRKDPGGRVVYRFDHLLPGHFYHLDLTLAECDHEGRLETVYVDGNQIAEVDLSSGDAEERSILLDPALYANRAISVTVEADPTDGAVVAAIALHDVDYRYADSGGTNDPEYSVGQDDILPYGWLDGVAPTPQSCGTLPYQSLRIDQSDADPEDDPDNELRYQFDGLDPDKHYRVHLTFYECSGGRIQTVSIDDEPTGPTVDTSDHQQHDEIVDVPPTTYASEPHSIVVRITRPGYEAGALVNQIALEELTLVKLPTISNVRVSNVRDGSFTVSWLTNIPATGRVNFGPTAARGTVVLDDRGSDTSAKTHYVTITGLSPETPYYFDVVSGLSVDDNGGSHYAVTTGPTLQPRASDTVWGWVLQSDGITPAQGCIVYVTLQDHDSLDSTGEAAIMAALTDQTGAWSVNLGNARLSDLSGYFVYSPSGDRLKVEAHCGIQETGCLITDTANDTPTPDLILNVSQCYCQFSLPLGVGWNFLSLPVEPEVPYTAEGLCTDMSDQSCTILEVDRWYNDGWDGHVCGLPFNDFAIELGQSYFVKTEGPCTWDIGGVCVSSGVPLALVIGWNSIAVPHSDAYAAESLCSEIQSQGVDAIEIDRWYNNGWDGHICGLFFNDFTIEQGGGYFVKTASSGIVTPDAPTVSAARDEASEPHAPPQPMAQADVSISEIRVTNVRDGSLTVSWVTDGPATGYVNFGPTTALGSTAHDDRGDTTVDDTHHVTLSGLLPETTYYFDVVSGTTVDDNGGGHYTVTTGPTLGLPPSDTIYGQVLLADGLTPAQGAIVYITLQDADGKGSSGQSAAMSALVGKTGYWSANLGNARVADLSALFEYSPSGDKVILVAEGGEYGSSDLITGTEADSPAPVIQLPFGRYNYLYLPTVIRKIPMER